MLKIDSCNVTYYLIAGIATKIEQINVTFNSNQNFQHYRCELDLKQTRLKAFLIFSRRLHLTVSSHSNAYISAKKL